MFNAKVRYDLDEIVWVKCLNAYGQIVSIINDPREVLYKVRYVAFVDKQFDSGSSIPYKEITHYAVATYKRKDLRKLA